MDEVDRLSKVTKDQKAKLMELTDKGKKCLESFKAPQYKTQKEWWWRKTSAILNSMPGLGAVKTAKQWEKTYKDIKLYALKREMASGHSSETRDMPVQAAGDSLFPGRGNLVGADEVESYIEGSKQTVVVFNGQNAFHYGNQPPDAPPPPTLPVPVHADSLTVSFGDGYPSYFEMPPTSSAKSATTHVVAPEVAELKPKVAKKPKIMRGRKPSPRYPGGVPSSFSSASSSTMGESRTFLQNKMKMLERIASAQEAQADVAKRNAKNFEEFVNVVARFLYKQ